MAAAKQSLNTQPVVMLLRLEYTRSDTVPRNLKYDKICSANKKNKIRFDSLFYVARL